VPDHNAPLAGLRIAFLTPYTELYGSNLSMPNLPSGPAWGGVHAERAARRGNGRVAMGDPVGGPQPIGPREGGLVLAGNGETYNHAQRQGSLPASPLWAGPRDEPVSGV